MTRKTLTTTFCTILAVALVTTGAHGAPVQPGNPDHLWTFDDASVGAGVGTIVANTGDNPVGDMTLLTRAEITSTAKYGNALAPRAAAGTAAGAEMAGANIDLGGGDVTIATYVRRNSGASDGRIMGSDYTQVAIEVNSAGINVLSWDDTGYAPGAATSALPDDETWYHFGLVYSDSADEIKLYVDGALIETITGVNSGPGSGNINTISPDFVLGSKASPYDRGLDGQLDEFAIWTGTALSADNMEWLAANSLAGGGGGEIPAPAALPAGLALLTILGARRRRA